MAEEEKLIEKAANTKRVSLWRGALRTFVVTWGIVLGLLVIAGAVEAVRGALQLSEVLADGRAAGETFELEKLIPAIPGPEQNASTQLLAVADRLREAYELIKGGPPLWQFDESRRLRSLHEIDFWEKRRSIVSSETVSNRWAIFEPGLMEMEAVTDRIQEGLERPSFHSGFDYRRGFKDFELVPLSMESVRIADLLAFSTILHLRDGRPAKAKARLNALMRWCVLMKGDQLIITELFRYRVMDAAVRILRHAVEVLRWSDEELRGMQDVVGRWEIIESMIRSHELERAMSLDFYRAAAGDGAVRARQVETWEKVHDVIGEGWLTTPDIWLKRVHLPLWSMIWWRQECARSLRQWDLKIETLRGMRGRSLKSTKKQWLDLPLAHPVLFSSRDELRGVDRLRYVFESEFSFAEGLPVRALKLETERQMVLAALALKRFGMQSKGMPESLAELVPDFVPEAPVDAMDGGPLRYRKIGNDSYLLYSIGEDGVDDGGDSSPKKMDSEYTDLWDGRDACWPTLVVE